MGFCKVITKAAKDLRRELKDPRIVRFAADITLALGRQLEDGEFDATDKRVLQDTVRRRAIDLIKSRFPALSTGAAEEAVILARRAQKLGEKPEEEIDDSPEEIRELRVDAANLVESAAP